MWVQNLLFKINRAYDLFILGWNDADYDYAYLLILMEWKIDKMIIHFKELSDNQKNKGWYCSVGINKKIKVLLEMKELLTRIKEDNYVSRPTDARINDVSRFCELFHKHILTLWE